MAYQCPTADSGDTGKGQKGGKSKGWGGKGADKPDPNKPVAKGVEEDKPAEGSQTSKAQLELLKETQNLIKTMQAKALQMKPTLNIKVPTRTSEEYKEEEKDRIQRYRQDYNQKNYQKHKTYREMNKEQNQEYSKAYREINREHILEKKRIYRENHREELREKARIYKQQNREEINRRRRKEYKHQLEI